MESKINIVFEGKNKPEQQHNGDAGYDLKSSVDIIVESNKRVLVPTDIRIDIPFGYVGYIMTRSGLAFKNGIVVLNAPGVVDSGYKGELKVLLHNFSEDNFIIKQGDRIAQLVIQEIKTCNFIKGEVYSTNNQSERNDKGFGSTGV